MFKSPVKLSDIEPEPLQKLFSYWQKIRADRKMPAKQDFNPSDVPSLLPYITLIDVEENPRRYRTRLAGTENTRVLGFDPTGRYFEETPQLSGAIKRFTWLVEHKEPYLYRGSLKWSDKDFLDYYSIALPFSDDDKNVNILLFGVYYLFIEESEHGMEHNV
ncbi:PAS domain-containing protein [Emcibacter nanhaiensis]|uniref:PAS domain-containing protein n=1 Tax=Emcibacter nanhaiensis TaxID=1505037 RepID=A0A501PA63_9PROT|nr:PAS domain-containing protein [Emcibacter nanhaiensis]TPD57260.1 PAS domain-containing protein [Emcibacter nanhaiensis]